MVALKEAIKNEIRSILSENKLKEGRTVVGTLKSWKKGAKANIEGLGEGNYGFDPRAIAQYFTSDGVAKEDVSVFEMSNGSVELHASGDKDKFHEAKDNAIKKATGKNEAYGDEKVDKSVVAKGDQTKSHDRDGAKAGFGAGDDLDDDTIDRKATKGAKKSAKGVKGIEKEIAAKKDEKKSLKAKIDPLIAKFKSKELDKEAYLKKVGDAPKRIKAINDEVAKLEKALDAALVKETDDMREVAATAMDRDVNRKLLEIIKEAGAPLHEGAAGVKMHYDIARKAYMEGLTAGLNKD